MHISYGKSELTTTKAAMFVWENGVTVMERVQRNAALWVISKKSAI